jgi:uncharacterized damage-inducible protein DinB
VGNIQAIVSDLNYGRSQLIQAIEGLSWREMTQISLYQGWTVKDVLAHVLGWDRRVLHTLPLMLQNRASEVAGVEVDEFNRLSVAAGRDLSLSELLAEVTATHRRIVKIIAGLEHKEIDMRRERHGRTITIRSYVIDVMIEHEREHAAEIETWRKGLEQNVDPAAIKAALASHRADFWAAIAGLSQAEAQAQHMVGDWSVKDVVGHIADWGWRMLKAAQHIHDPSLPVVPPVSDTAGEEQWNEIMAVRRQHQTWAEVQQALAEVEAAMDTFVAALRSGDWHLRGPYPWPNDQGSLAELIEDIATHYADHTPELQQWRTQTKS